MTVPQQTTDTNEMTCSICHQIGHNKRTCDRHTLVAPEGKYKGLNAIQIEAIIAERCRIENEEFIRYYESLVAAEVAKTAAPAPAITEEDEETEDDASSVNTQEVCCECELTEKQITNGRNIQTLHYINGKTYCLNCREPENSDDESDCSDGRDRDDDELSECEECGERYLLGEFNVVESEMKQYCYCDDCFATKIKDGEVIKNPEEDDEWIFQNDD